MDFCLPFLLLWQATLATLRLDMNIGIVVFPQSGSICSRTRPTATFTLLKLWHSLFRLQVYES